MNRHRTISGLGPTKASSTTTCQKCLQKDSYECKASVQSRPYVSRPSRTQQLRNPKLKPALSEQKLDPEPPIPAGGNDQEHQDVSTEPQDVRSGSGSGERPSKKARRSASLSSSTSVSTISTKRSNSPQNARERSPVEDTRGSRRRVSRSKSPIRQRRTSSSSRSRSPRRFEDSSKRKRVRSISPRRRTRERYSSDEQSGPDIAASRTRLGRPGGQRKLEGRNAPGRNDSHRPDGIVQHRTSEGGRRERSLSPYSRRLALTQAMNGGR